MGQTKSKKKTPNRRVGECEKESSEKPEGPSATTKKWTNKIPCVSATSSSPEPKRFHSNFSSRSREDGLETPENDMRVGECEKESSEKPEGPSATTKKWTNKIPCVSDTSSSPEPKRFHSNFSSRNREDGLETPENDMQYNGSEKQSSRNHGEDSAVTVSNNIPETSLPSEINVKNHTMAREQQQVRQDTPEKAQNDVEVDDSIHERNTRSKLGQTGTLGDDISPTAMDCTIDSLKSSENKPPILHVKEQNEKDNAYLDTEPTAKQAGPDINDTPHENVVRPQSTASKTSQPGVDYSMFTSLSNAEQLVPHHTDTSHGDDKFDKENKKKRKKKNTLIATLSKKDYQQQIEQLQRQLEAEKKEKEDLRSRLSEIAGTRLVDNNPNITDLSDGNRATKLAEQFSELYDNQWTDAFTNLTQLGYSEEEAIRYLSSIFKSTFSICERRINDKFTDLQQSLFDFVGVGQMDDEMKLLLKKIKDTRKVNVSSMIELQKEGIFDAVCNDLCLDDKTKNACSTYISYCIHLSLLMNIQDPPLFPMFECKSKERFDKNLYKPYTTSGSKMHYVVWPVLYLHRGGPLLAKGVAQPRKKKMKRGNNVVSPREEQSTNPDTRSEDNNMNVNITRVIRTEENGVNETVTGESHANDPLPQSEIPGTVTHDQSDS